MAECGVHMVCTAPEEAPLWRLILLTPTFLSLHFLLVRFVKDSQSKVNLQTVLALDSPAGYQEPGLLASVWKRANTVVCIWRKVHSPLMLQVREVNENRNKKDRTWLLLCMLGEDVYYRRVGEHSQGQGLWESLKST